VTLRASQLLEEVRFRFATALTAQREGGMPLRGRNEWWQSAVELRARGVWWTWKGLAGVHLTHEYQQVTCKCR
jgi:hypothetical protein